MDIKFGLYENQKSFEPEIISVENYIGFVQYGTNQDIVLEARIKKSNGDKDGYKKLKESSKVITGSCVMNSGSKAASNIKQMNGLIVIDVDQEIDEDKFNSLKNDKHSFIIHRSFGGDGVCIFVKIDSSRFEDSFLGLSEYYFKEYDITIDEACKNKNRLRYLSYDPDVYHNPKATKFTPKNIKKFKEPVKVNYVYAKDDFDNILSQISDRRIDLCQEDYFRYVRIGIAIASKFGMDGADKFHFICSFGFKYDPDRTEFDYKGFVRNATGKCSIGTFYYYCKEAGIDVYSEKTLTIINRVKVAKSQGTPTVQSIVSNLKTANNIEASEDDKDLIKELISSSTDYSEYANMDVPEIEQLERFIIDSYDPSFDVITNQTHVNGGTVLTDTEMNDIYINCQKSFNFNVSVNDVRAIINSNAVRKINIMETFLAENKARPTGYIEEYAKCIYPQSEYNIWAFRKWIVGALHNWTSNVNEKLVCPLTLVLTGQQHGTGKTSFLRNIMPKELDKYIVEAKINGHDKDSMYTLCNSLLVLDDEFGGKAFKDVKEYKAISDMNIVTQRRPYERESKTFKRRAILCGTTNEIDILKDVTGNRRILPINVQKVDYNKIISIDKTALIIEAYNLLKSGFDWILRTEEDIEYLRVNSQQNENIMPIEEVFFKHFSLEQTDTHSLMVVLNQGEMLEYLNINSILKPTKYDLKEVLIKNKITYTAYRIQSILKKGVKLYMRPDLNNGQILTQIDEEPPF